MVIQHNMMAMNGMRMQGIVNNRKNKSIEKLSSGYRINRAADDAAGLAISEKMRRQIRGITQGVANSQDGVSICQVADGALAEVNDMLHRMTELSVKAANGTLNQEDREAIQLEISQLKEEISKVGKTTTFNEIPVFDTTGGRTKERQVGMELISSPSAKVGYMAEAYKVGQQYFPAASLDFGGINSGSVKNLYDKSFSFTCSQSCAETFTFTFVDGDGSQSKILNPGNNNQAKPHNYQIDIHGCTNGEQVLDALFNYVKANPAANGSGSGANTVNVSHSNIMIKDSSNKLVIRATSDWRTTPEKAIQDYLANHADKKSPYGKADFAQITGYAETRITNIIPIQYGTEAGHFLDLEIERMNGEILGVDDIDVTTQSGARTALTQTRKATAIINEQRAKLGAQQNRLEHTIKNENNVIENTTAAESRIRDTDMAKEMVDESIQNVLEQAGNSVLAQANQSKQGILTVLGS